MKPTIKIAFIFNNTSWATIDEKIKAAVAFYSSTFTVVTTIKNTYFINIPFVQVDTIGGINNTPGTTNTVEKHWYDQNVTLLAPDADVIVFYLAKVDLPPMQTSVGIMQGKYILSAGPMQSCIFGINESDHVYQNGIDQGNTFVVFACHEISHALYAIQGQPDNTHIDFYSGQPTKVLDDLKNGKLTKLNQLYAYCNQLILFLTTQINEQKIMTTIPPRDPDALNAWDTSINCEHNVRALCDLKGLDAQGKDIIQACVHQESDFMNYKPDGTPVSNKNLHKDGTLSSTDWGVAEINDYYHIGAGKDFPSVDFVMQNPQKCVEFMIDMYLAGKLALWSSYKTGAYRKYLKLS